MRGKRSSSEAVGRPEPSRQVTFRSNFIVPRKWRGVPLPHTSSDAGPDCGTRMRLAPAHPAFARAISLLPYTSHLPDLRETLKRLQRKRLYVADTTKIEDKLERKKLKRAARKKAAPKAKRTGPRGENKKKLKKLARGVSKR